MVSRKLGLRPAVLFASFSSRGSPCRGLWGHSRPSPQAAPGRGGASCRSFTHVAWRLGQARPAWWAGHLAARPHFSAAPGWDRAAESVQTPQGTEGGGAGLPENAWHVLPGGRSGGPVQAAPHRRGSDAEQTGDLVICDNSLAGTNPFYTCVLLLLILMDT